MPQYHIQIEDDKGQHLDVHVVDGKFQDAEDYINANKFGSIFKVFEDVPLMLAKGDCIRYERTSSGLFDVQRVPLT